MHSLCRLRGRWAGKVLRRRKFTLGGRMGGRGRKEGRRMRERARARSPGTQCATTINAINSELRRLLFRRLCKTSSVCLSFCLLASYIATWAMTMKRNRRAFRVEILLPYQTVSVYTQRMETVRLLRTETAGRRRHPRLRYTPPKGRTLGGICDMNRHAAV